MKPRSKNPSKSGRLSRRGFLGASGAGAAALAAPAAAAPVRRTDAAPDVRRVVLQDTRHIRTYYARARW